MPKKNFVPGEVLRAADVNEYLTSSQNLIINGAFEINQRAFTSTTTSGALGFDRWRLINAGGTATYSAETFTPGEAPGGGYEFKNFARIVTAGQSGTTVQTTLRQSVENVTTLAGQTATVSFWAKADSGTPKIAVEVFQIFGTGGSPSSNVVFYVNQITLSTSWARYSLSFEVPSIIGKTFGTNNNDYLSLNLWVSAGSNFDERTGSLGVQNNTFDFWGVQLEEGSTATPFSRNANSIQGELAACQRYYYRLQATAGGDYFSSAAAVSATSIRTVIQFPTSMRAAPTAVESTTIGNYGFLSAASFTATSISFQSGTTETVGLVFGSSGLTTGAGGVLRALVSTAYLGFSAEL
jgi:hypothetical protein